MSLIITSYPQKEIDNNSSKISKWSAVHHSIIFGMHRKDFDIIASAIDGSPLLMKVQIQNATISDGDISVGDSIYLETNTGSGTFVVTAVNAPSSLTVTRGTFTAYGFGYCNFLNRLNYFAKTIFWGVDEFNAYYFIGTSINKPDSTGRLKVDASSFLKAAVDYVNDFQYDVVNKKQLSQGGAFNLTYSENWQLFEGPFAGVSNTDLRYFVNSAKQIQDLYGQNMGAYVPFYFDLEPDPDTKALFLSDFEKPTYFPNFPFDISFIYSESLAGIVTTREEERFDVNGVSTGTTSTQLSNAEVQNVNRLMITEPSAGDKELDVWLESDGTVDCLEYMAEGYVLIGYVQSLCGIPDVDNNPVVDGELTAEAQSESS